MSHTSRCGSLVHPEEVVFGMNGQHGTGRQANDLFGDAAEQQVRQPRVTVCADDDQVDRVSFRVVDDVSDGLADDHRANDGEVARQSGFHSHCQLQFGVVNELRHGIAGQDPRSFRPRYWRRIGDDMQCMQFDG